MNYPLSRNPRKISGMTNPHGYVPGRSLSPRHLLQLLFHLLSFPVNILIVFYSLYRLTHASFHSISYHQEYILLRQRNHPEPIELEMTIPAFDPLPPQYYLRIISDAWVGCETLVPVSFRHLLLPDRLMPYTDLINLTPLPTGALDDPAFEQLYSKFDTFNPIQTQLFHVLYHTDIPVLLGAPTGSGKTIVAEIALLVSSQNTCLYPGFLGALYNGSLFELSAALCNTENEEVKPAGKMCLYSAAQVTGEGATERVEVQARISSSWLVSP